MDVQSIDADGDVKALEHLRHTAKDRERKHMCLVPKYYCCKCSHVSLGAVSAPCPTNIDFGLPPRSRRNEPLRRSAIQNHICFGVPKHVDDATVAMLQLGRLWRWHSWLCGGPQDPKMVRLGHSSLFQFAIPGHTCVARLEDTNIGKL